MLYLIAFLYLFMTVISPKFGIGLFVLVLLWITFIGFWVAVIGGAGLGLLYFFG
jgi:hypothetical protein